jgi:hypothetical protein
VGAGRWLLLTGGAERIGLAQRLGLRAVFNLGGRPGSRRLAGGGALGAGEHGRRSPYLLRRRRVRHTAAAACARDDADTEASRYAFAP